MRSQTIINNIRDRNEPETITFHYRGDYHFTVRETVTVRRKDPRKKIYIGEFLSSNNVAAPEGCSLDTRYCIKKFMFPIHSNGLPQQREHFDLFPFTGKHLRQIVTMDEQAREIVELIKKGVIDQEAEKLNCSCMIIEPCYTTFDFTLFRSPEDKIDCILQVVEALRELKESDFTEYYGEIKAHRDLKFSNVMLELKPGEKPTVKLIDFPSIKTDCHGGSEGTVPGAFSAGNTAPEDLLPGLEVSEKTDVFALGIMLAELFGVWNNGRRANPLHILFESDKLQLSSQERCREYFSELLKAYENGHHSRWLQDALHPLKADWSIEEACPGIRELFEWSTHLLPEHRLSLDDFEERLIKIRHTLDGRPSPLCPEKFNIFLVDTDFMDQYRKEYIRAAERVRQETGAEPVLITYASGPANRMEACNCCLEQVSSQGILTVANLTETLRAIPATVIESSRKQWSPLTGVLYAVFDLLSNSPMRQEFNGDIHIFSHTPPTQNNCCILNEGDPLGHTVYAGTPAQRNPDVNIQVHSRSGTTEDWYTLIPFAQPRAFGGRNDPTAGGDTKKAPPKASSVYIYDANGNAVEL